MSVLTLSFLICLSTGEKPTPEGTRLLAEHCLVCHSGEKPKGGLDLGVRQKALKGGLTGPALAPGDPKKSLLLEMVKKGEMPPKKPLDANSIGELEQWIKAGALYSQDPIDPFQFTTSKRAGRDWWSLQPLAPPPLPKINNRFWPLEPLDFFILKKLEAKGITPSPRAGWEKLLRRVSLNLTGLSPSIEQIQAFMMDPSPSAYANFVDRHLTSPQYGEKWARHWLDVVRYGESDGFERNNPRENSWPYRDWVIEALNRDMPYDEFCKMQIAGDAFRPGDANSLRATGFLVAGIHNTVLGTLPETKELARQDELEDLIGAVGQTFLGLTLNCGRCHDHKFDPFTQHDYYKLTATLGGFRPGNSPLPDPERESQIAQIQKELVQVELPLGQYTMQVATKAGLKPSSKLPRPLAAWDFTKGLKDLKGDLDISLEGGAKLTEGGLVLDGKTGLARTGKLTSPLGEKTLEAWVRLGSLDQKGGGVISVQSLDGSVFDSLVFGEQDAGQWMAGSNNFLRTKSFNGPKEKTNELVQVAITWRGNGEIQGFRNGQPYGKEYASKGQVVFSSGNSLITLGVRHFPSGGNRMLAGAVARARVFDRALSGEEIRVLYQAGGHEIPEALFSQFLTGDEQASRQGLLARQKELQGMRGEILARKSSVGYLPVSSPPAPAYFLRRGQVSDPGEAVLPSSISTLTMMPKWLLDAQTPDGKRREQLARWITPKENPLFARVMVNRVWHYHFGAGIVDTPSDFGFNGGKATHPELLDYLAGQFQEHGYSLKWLHRTIVMSQTYAQASRAQAGALVKDAENRLLWRWSPKRLDAEVLRDTLLYVSNRLDQRMGGPGVSDYKTTFNNGTTFYDPVESSPEQTLRRSIYRFVPRGANPGAFDCFDCPDNSASAPRRTSTTTPQQALSLWNGAFTLNRALDLQQRTLEHCRINQQVGTAPQVQHLFRSLLLRKPGAMEEQHAVQLVETHGLTALARALLNSNEFLTVD